MEMYALAARNKWRFETRKGQLTVEDLWDLPLETTARQNGPSLDEIAVALHNLTKEGEPTSFVNRKNDSARNRATAFQINQTKFSIVKHIIDIKLEEEEAALQARENREKRQRILSLIAEKQDGEMQAKSLDELRAMLAELD